MTMPYYQKVNAIFSLSNNLPSPAEVHGMICGYITAGKNMDGKSWLDPMLVLSEGADQDLTNAYRTILLELYEVSSIRLQSFEFDFELLLPEDDEPLQQRAEALSHWCQGFMTALNRAGINEDNIISHDVKDALIHISEISTFDYDNIDVTEQDEQAYEEVLEYVRMAVLMVYSEIAMEQEQNSGVGGRHFH